MSIVIPNKLTRVQTIPLSAIMEDASKHLLGGFYEKTPGLDSIQWVKQGGIAGLFRNKNKGTLKYVHSVNGESITKLVDENQFNSTEDLISWTKRV